MGSINKLFVHEYLNANAPTGYEYNGQKIWIDYVKQYVDDVFTDAYGNAVGIINPGAEYKVVIEAHADEISWAVNYITNEGYIYVARNGGSDFEIAPSMRAIVHLDNGNKIPAVFGWPAIHTRKSKEDSKTPNCETVILDCGCDSDKEVRDLGIHVGTIVTFDAKIGELNNGKYFVGRAFDNRMGGVTIAEVARRIHECNDKLEYGLYICNCVQEEVGLRGSAMIANRIHPNLAIATDVTHDTQSPLYNKKKHGDISCGKGPVIAYAPAVHHKVANFEIQNDFCAPSTGTDTDSFAYCQEGIPSALISLPLKYMHTTVEMVNANDLDSVIKLMYFTLKNITPDFNTSYF